MTAKKSYSKKKRTFTTVVSLVVALIAVLIYEFSDLQHSDNQNINPNTNDNGKLTVVFYNMENLFDPEDAPTHNDDEFTPNGEKKWTYDRYHNKLKHLAEVLKLIGGDEYPDIIGVAEVEDRKVLEDLINTNELKNVNYKIIHEESSDPRGIDVALIYKPSDFQYISHKQIFIYDRKGRKMRTRPILQVEGYFHGEKVYIFVNHWKSRVPSQTETEWKRITAAAALYNATKKILKEDPNANIIIIGDFNDTCLDKSIYKTLKARLNKNDITKYGFYNAMATACKNKDIGTVYHNGWFIFDQIIVSQALIDTAGLYINADAKIFTGDEVLKNGKPNRTYSGKKYLGGISDHLPVYITIKY